MSDLVTITLPQWLVYLIGVMFLLQCIKDTLAVYVDWLKAKVEKHKINNGGGNESV